MTAFYNEIDPYVADWLRNLIAAGHIAPGVVDTRSIEDIEPRELTRYTQCHFFAGVGVWSLALRLAGWPDSRPVWTGSCPCQPFSAAGKGAGFSDERHLWPAWHHLVSQCRPPEIFGEQVASKDAGPWLDLVQDDLEAVGYSFGAIPFPSAGVGAPHIRDRLYWVADSDGSARGQRCADVRGWTHGSDAQARPGSCGGGVLVGLADPVAIGSSSRSRDASTPDRALEFERSRAAGFVVDASSARLAQRIGVGRVPGSESGADTRQAAVGAGVHVGRLAVSSGERRDRWQGAADRSVSDGSDAGRIEGDDGASSIDEARLLGLADTRSGDARREGDATNHAGPKGDGSADQSGGRGRALVLLADDDDDDDDAGLSRFAGLRLQRPDLHDADGRRVVGGFWADADWIPCRDNKWRPVEPGSFPLAHGAPARVGRLRAFGNAINAEAARAFVEAYLGGQQ